MAGGRRRRGSLGALNFGEATGDQYRKTIEAPFFEKYLKDRHGFRSEGYGELSDGREQVGAVCGVASEDGICSEAKLYLEPGRGVEL